MLIAAAAAAPEAARRRSRLLSCEFLFYYAAVGLGALALVREAYLFSLRESRARTANMLAQRLKTLFLSRARTRARAAYSEPYSQTFDGRPLYRLSGLREGWLWGRRAIDLRDHQYAAFRSALPALTAAALGFLALSRLVAVASRGSLSARLAFNAVFSLAFLLHAHGACVFFVAALAAANWALASALRGTRLLVPATWIFALTTLFANAAYDGYRFADLSAGLAWLDQHRGATRWQLHFNLVLLRLVSFNLDSHWAAAGRGEDATRVRRHLLTCAACRSGAQPTVDAGKADAVPTNTPCLWMREKLPQPPAAWHSPLVYTVYLFYTPLLLAGPTMTFNSFVSQLRQPPTHLTGSVLLQYFARLLFAAALLEGALHVAYVFAVSQGDAWREFSREQILALAWTTLNVMWLKFLVLWRFFRMWALADGMEPEENMNRCVNNVYSLQGFWRAWHRSFNRWLVRYIYVPLGARRCAALRRNALSLTAACRRLPRVPAASRRQCVLCFPLRCRVARTKPQAARVGPAHRALLRTRACTAAPAHARVARLAAAQALFPLSPRPRCCAQHVAHGRRQPRRLQPRPRRHARVPAPPPLR